VASDAIPIQGSAFLQVDHDATVPLSSAMHHQQSIVAALECRNLSL